MLGAESRDGKTIAEGTGRGLDNYQISGGAHPEWRKRHDRRRKRRIGRGRMESDPDLICVRSGGQPKGSKRARVVNGRRVKVKGTRGGKERVREVNQITRRSQIFGTVNGKKRV